MEGVVLRGAVTALGGLPRSGPGGGAERTPAGRGRVCPGLVETAQHTNCRLLNLAAMLNPLALFAAGGGR